jgi:small subunit ribosomal protein S1
LPFKDHGVAVHAQPFHFVRRDQAKLVISCKHRVRSVDPEKRRVALGLKQLETDPWQDDIPQRYRPGDLVRGVVSKLTSFGAFVTLEDGLEGLLHISELSDKKISSPEEILAVGDVVDVLVLRVEPESRKIGLSMRTDTVAAREGAKPGLVIRSDQIAAAENPQQLVEQALEQAQQRDGTDVEGPEVTRAGGPGGKAEPLPSEGIAEHGEAGQQAPETTKAEVQQETLPPEGEDIQEPEDTTGDAAPPST